MPTWLQRLLPWRKPAPAALPIPSSPPVLGLAPAAVQPEAVKAPNMKFADWLRGVEGVAAAAVSKVFDTARAAVAAVPLIPQNLKDDAKQILDDAQGDLLGLESLAGTLVGHAAADAVDDVTTLLLNAKNALAGAKSWAELSAAEKTALQQTWTAIKAQGDTLVSQAMAGIDPTKPSTPAPVVQPS